MRPSTIAAITSSLEKLPNCRSEAVTNEGEISNAEKQLGVTFSPDYKQFLNIFGGAVVGRRLIYGLRLAEYMHGNKDFTVIGATNQYRTKKWPSVSAWYVVSADGAGNPIGVDSEGAVWIFDHNQMRAEKIYAGFDEWIVNDCLVTDPDDDED
ncbi:MAG: SMI1/KNR4 family protein [Planctomycetes bacterium]|nr:SMI1/KNR4 family protein [Planctomycetota bacterium]